MAKLTLENIAKGKLKDGFASKVTVAALSKNTKSASSSKLNVGTVDTDLTGLKEKLALQKTGVGSFVLNNSLSNQPLLVFTVANGEQPKEYHLYEVDGSDYYRNVTLPITRSAAANDMAVQLFALTVTFRGDGEV